MAAYTGTPRTWAAAEKVTATLLNAELRDPIAALTGAWTSWTPTLAQGASTDIAKTVTYAKYVQVGKLVICQVKLEATAAGTAGSAVTISLPVTAATSTIYVGSGFYSDNGVYYGAVCYLNSTTAAAFGHVNATDGGLVGTSPSLAVASGDFMGMTMTYEAA